MLIWRYCLHDCRHLYWLPVAEKYDGITTVDAKKYREPEKENARLKKLVADLSLDNAILKEIAEESCKPDETTAGC